VTRDSCFHAAVRLAAQRFLLVQFASLCLLTVITEPQPWGACLNVARRVQLVNLQSMWVCGAALCGVRTNCSCTPGMGAELTVWKSPVGEPVYE